MKKYLIVLLVFTLFALKSKSGGPYTINGPTSVTATQEAAYYISPADGTTYAWTVVNGTIVDGGGTSGVTVQWDIPSGQSGELDCSIDGGGDNLVIVWPGGG